MSSRTLPTSFDPFGPGTRTPPPQQTFTPGMGKSSTPENTSHYPQSSPPWLPSHRQQKAVVDCTPFNDLGSWTRPPNLGINRDGTCAQYQKHFPNAMGDNVLSITKPRSDILDAFSMDGHNRPHGSGRLAETPGMVDQLEIVMNRVESCEAENASLRRNLHFTKHQLANSRDYPERLRGAPASLVSNTTSNWLAPVGDFMGPKTCAPSSATPFREQNIQVLTFSSLASLPWKPEPHDAHARVIQNPEPIFLPRPRLTYASVASTHALSDTTSTRREPPSLSTQSPGHSLPKPLFSANISRSSPGREPGVRYPKTVEDLKDLMASASNETVEGVRAMAIVKRLCSRAHNTPREHKTEVQKFALAHWRNPLSPGSRSLSSPDVVKPNPRLDDSVEIWYEYYCTHPHALPKGVRKTVDGKPMMSDLTANRAVSQMRPSESGPSRREFMNQIVDMFSVVGIYVHIVERSGFDIAPQILFAPFSGLVTVENVAWHVARCGVTPQDARDKFEPWAKHSKTIRLVDGK